MNRHHIFAILSAAIIGWAFCACSVGKMGFDNHDTLHVSDSPSDEGDDPTRPTNDKEDTPTSHDTITAISNKYIVLHDSLLIQAEQPLTPAKSIK